MDIQESKVNPLFERFEEYSKLTLELYKMKSIAMSAKTISYIIIHSITIIFVLIFLLFSSFALALVLGENFKSQLIGYLGVAGIYAFLAICFFLFSSKLRRRFTSLILKKITA